MTQTLVSISRMRSFHTAGLAVTLPMKHWPCHKRHAAEACGSHPARPLGSRVVQNREVARATCTSRSSGGRGAAQRHGEPEGAAAARLAGDADLAPVGPRRPPWRCKGPARRCHPGQPGRGSTSRRCARETQEATPGPASSISKRTCPAPGKVPQRHSLAWRGVADGVGDQVGEDELQSVHVDEELQSVSEVLHLELDLVLLSQRAQAGPLPARRWRSQRAPGAEAPRGPTAAWRGPKGRPRCPGAARSRRGPACSKSFFFSVSSPAAPSRQRWMAMRSEVRRRAELVRHRRDQVVLQLVEAPQPGHVLEHHRRPAQAAALRGRKRAWRGPAGSARPRVLPTGWPPRSRAAGMAPCP